MSNKTSKHQEEGKHSLGYDIFFKGKKEEISEDDLDSQISIEHHQDNFQYEVGSLVYDEAYNNYEQDRKRKITKRVHEVLTDKTDIKLQANRRKPSKDAFNKYFILLKKELQEEKFTNIEIFVELAYYFSENLLSIFELLDNKWRSLIITELKKHVGDIDSQSKEVNLKNLKEGCEIEFIHYDDIDNINLNITGIILTYDKLDQEFKVDSFEKIYFIKLEKIVKILNNTKYKHNINILNNIDFL